MSNYSYVAVDSRGDEQRGILDVQTQTEAIRRVREMGLFPTKVKPASLALPRRRSPMASLRAARPDKIVNWRFGGRIRSAHLVVFTRQLATMLGAGMPLMRSLRILEEQSGSVPLQKIAAALCHQIENGCSFSEALSGHPRVFNALFINLVKAGEAAGALETTLNRLADFMEKAQKLRGKLISALYYPATVIVVAVGVLAMLMVFVVPTFQRVFEGLLEGAALPLFTRFVFGLSRILVHQLPLLSACLLGFALATIAAARTSYGSFGVDRLKLATPLLGTLFRKAAISRFARTLGTLAGNGVPILQALAIVKETVGNRIISKVIGQVYEHVKQGDPIAPVLKSSGLFPPMVAGLVDVGEQTGALPDMLLKLADTYDDEFDSAAKGLTSLIEPVLIVLLAVLVGSIVIAMFLPLIQVINFDGTGANPSL
ncbi:MAG TPA: type II secretion system F family protein [Verrucomicrobiae bacterium]|nr:type II secretion system F family protein [Verrucomicrobiae bacterium]